MKHISDLQQIDKHSWQAKYHGNFGNYTVMLTLDKKLKVKSFSCSCPSECLPCKHIEYVRTEIVAKLSNVEPAIKNMEVSVESVLQNVTLNELRGFIVDYAESDNNLKQAFMLKFAEMITMDKNGIAERKGNPYSSVIADALENVDFVAEYESDDVFFVDVNFLDEWVRKAKDFVEHGKYEDAILICKAGIEELADFIYSEYHSGEDISEIRFDDLTDAFFDLLESMADNGNVNGKDLYEYCKGEVEKDKYTWTKAFAGFNNLAAKLAGTIYSDDFIALQENMLSKIKDKSSNKAEIILQRLIAFYISINQEELAEQILENNLQFESFRKKVVEKRIENKQFKEAKKLIAEALKKPFLLYKDEWKGMLLKIASEENDSLSVRKIALDFLEHGFRMKYFSVYKSTFKREDWTKGFERLYNLYDRQMNYWNEEFKSNIGELLAAEKLNEQLLKYCERYASLEHVERYYNVFVSQFPERTLALFKKKIDLYLAEKGEWNNYEYLVKMLRLVQEINGGGELVSQMVVAYRALYKNRRAIIELIKDI
ncbi:MAG: hypothetical protein LBH04_08110 [Tannerellaceae bacterium]|jgi:hypothetical protein|nr:hypothetical protein [Tannerellaceae bacterium]